jgi:hypothetical protein
MGQPKAVVKLVIRTDGLRGRWLRHPFGTKTTLGFIGTGLNIVIVKRS